MSWGTTRYPLTCLFSEMFVDHTWGIGIITRCIVVKSPLREEGTVLRCLLFLLLL